MENEAKKIIKKFCEDRMNFARGKDMSDKELEIFCKFSEALNLSISSLEEIQQYRAIGTVEECREARERQRAKKPVYPYVKSLPACPNCGEVNLQHENEYGNVDANYDFCPDCGQAIDRSDAP